ncbi:pectinesterase inhibitor 7-like [Momordica charantia]|uniref:Pectinesterase inhibitor 7-like n=1 Tax=Momordica charantia TaxID=3673 RepID=A0A6J1DFW8_MOMCH|nr:pectinesterase inhibitor 7-like [Momordica charantia]
MEDSYFPLPITAILLIILINLSNATIDDTQFIKATCQTTPYPDLCFSSLSADAVSVHGSLRSMTIAALTVALTHTRSASSMVASLAKSNALAPQETWALRDCIEELGDSVEELQSSVAELKDGDGSRPETDDIRTWVSAALTDDDTCMEGLVGDGGGVKESVRGLVVDVAQLTSIALSLVSHLK